MTGESRSALGVPAFRRYAGCSLLSMLAAQMASVAIGWQVYAATHSALSLGYVGLSQFAPSIVFSLATGHAADAFDRRKLLATTHLGLLATLLGLLAVGLAGIGDQVGWVYALLVLYGTARAFQNPVSQALTPNLVPIAQLPSAVAWSSSLWQIAVVVGPALGGLLHGFAGATVVYGVAAVFEAIAALGIASLDVATTRERVEHSIAEAVAGWAFVRGQPVILGALSLDLFAVLLGGAVALLPIYARDILAVGPRGLGFLRSAPACGALVVALLLARRPLSRRSGVTMLVCVAVFGLATIVFGISRNFWLSLGALAVGGAADMVSVVIRHALIQINTPDAMRGRVSAINMIFVGASNELGEFESGLLAACVGAVPAVVVGGVGSCVVVAVCALVFPALRRADRLDLGARDVD